MSLHTKTLATIGITLAALLCALYLIVSNAWLGSFSVLEERLALRDVARAQEALANEIQHIQSLTLDWADWDDLYTFVEDGNQKFIDDNFNDTSFANLGINALIIAHPSGKITYAAGFDLLAETPAEVPPSLLARLRPGDPLLDDPAGRAGLLTLPEGTFAFASRPILTSQHEGPARGRILFARIVDAAMLDRLSKQTHLTLAIYRRDGDDLPATARAAFAELEHADAMGLRPIDEAQSAGTVLMADAAGRADLVLHVLLPREVYQHGRSGLRVLLGSLLLAAIAFGAGILAFLQTQVLSRLGRLSTEVRSIRATRDFSRRAVAVGKDELARVATGINEMLDALEAAAREREENQIALRRSAEQLQQAAKMESVGRLAGGIAHDFNNLLVVIIGYTELLRGRTAADPGLRKPIEQIHKAADRAARLTQQLLAYGRKQVVQPRVLDLGAFLVETEVMLGRMIGENVEIVRTADAESRCIRFDPTQLTQVLLNLALNARDAMPCGGQLRFRIARVVLERAEDPVPAGTWVQLQVEDTGVGMDARTLTQIFEPFFTTKEVGKGTGLGLAMVYGVMRQHDAHITVTSTPRQGTTFRLWFPECAPADLPAAPPEPSTRLARGTETVLLVEDDPTVRELARMVLAEAGFRVLDAGTSEDALAISQSSPEMIHALVTDVVMPRMNGRQMAHAITDRHPNARVLFMSGYPNDPTVREAILSGAAFLSKPFTPASLTGALRELLDAR